MNGVTLRRIPPGMPGAGIPVVRLHYSADPSFTPDKVAQLASKYTSEARRRREMEIEYEALEGELLYPQFHRERNIINPFDVSDPEYWTLWMGLDPHPRTAHGMVWEAFNKHGDQVVVGELWPEFGTRYGPTDGARWSTRDYAEAIKFFESDSDTKPSPFEWARGRKLNVGGRRFMDTFGKAANSDEGEDYFATYQRLGNELGVNLVFQTALKGHDNLAKAQDTIARKLLPSAGGGPPIMRVFADCYETIDEFENVRFPEGNPERPMDERPITYQKHCLDCVAEGSLITTTLGDIPIEYVMAGDLVLTRAGWKRVLDAWCVGERDVWSLNSSAGRLIVTGDHRVWVSGGWKECVNVTERDILSTCQKQYVLTDTLTTVAGIIGMPTSFCRSIERRGRSLEDRFREAFRSITRKASAIESAIWNASLLKPIPNAIGTSNRVSQRSALAAGSRSRPLLSERGAPMPAFAEQIVGRRGGIEQGLTISRGPAASATLRLPSIATTTPRPALRSAAAYCRPRPCGRATVYDLSVEGEHEFFANGILVHNCIHYIETQRPGHIMRRTLVSQPASNAPGAR